MKRAAAILVMIMLLAAGCGGSKPAPSQGETPANKPAKERVVTVAVGVDASTLDPAMSTNITDKNAFSAIYDTLIYRDDEMKLQPNLATEWKAVDPKTWEFKLRQGVKFHNGEPFTAEAVKFTLERILDPNLKAPAIAQFTAVQRVEVVDDLTVRIVTKDPYPVLVNVLSELWVVPPKYTQEMGQATLAQKPVGTGAFKFVEWVKDSQLVFEANTEYWKGAPQIDRVIFKPVPERATRIAMLKTGEADIVADIPPNSVADLQKDPGVKIATAEGARSFFIGMDTTQGGPLADKRVRQALNYAIDVESIIKNTLMGYGQRLPGLLNHRQFGYAADVKGYTYNPEKAKQLLKEAGYPEGFTIQFDTPDGRYLMDKEVAQAVAGQLAKVGINAQVNVKEWAAFVGQFKAKAPPMWFMGWSIPTFDADAILFALTTPKQTYARWSHPKVTELLTEARSTVDADKRSQNYREAQLIIEEEAPFIFLYQLKDIYGHRTRVNWNPRSDERILLYGVTVNE